MKSKSLSSFNTLDYTKYLPKISTTVAANSYRRADLVARHFLHPTLNAPLSTAAPKMTSTSSAIPPAPWRDLFASHLSQSSSSEFTLSTVAYDPQKSRAVPRARVCGFRGFFPTPQLHPSAIDDLKKQGDGLNPDVYESDMLSFTTDARMEKVLQIQPSPSSGSFVGSDVELVFWLKDVANQWRIKGTALIIGNSDSSDQEEKAREEVQTGLRVRSGESGDGWTWERQVTTYFANHTPVLRGSFKSPPPGQPKSQVPQDPDLNLGQKVHDIHDPVARKYFRVVVIRPEQVERLDLSDYENLQRRVWSLTPDGTQPVQWEETELWP